jgi:serine/threonine-protein kinase
VYKARHTVLNKPLAIKVLRPDVSNDDEIITRFRQEAQSATAIGNQHIIDISDFGVLPDGSTYFVMEFLDGIDLTTAIETENPMDHGRAVQIAKQLCLALGSAHDAGIVHRDLKPDNIYLIKRGGQRDFVKVLDFGIAKVGSGTKRLTKAGQVFGTPHYMSPEQCSGSGTDHRTDIYALGVILYEMCCGRVPFDADNLMGVLTKHMYEQPIPPHELPPPVNVPPALEAVILKALAKSQEARYQSTSEMLSDLERVQTGHTPDAVIEAVERRSVTGLAARETIARGGLSMTIGGPDGLKRSKLPLILGGVGLLGALAVVGVIVAGMGSEPDPEPIANVTEVEAPPEDIIEEPEPPAVVENAANVQEQGSVTTVMVTIQTDPSGVEVRHGEQILGNTPLQIPRPTGSEVVQLTLRKAGFKEETVGIAAMTAESVTITMDRARRASRRGTMRTTMAAMETPMAEAPMETPMVQMEVSMRSLPQTEVLDPWQ